MIQTMRFFVVCTLVLSMLALCGCNSSKPSSNPSSETEQHDDNGEKHAETYAAAVDNLNELATSIKEALTANDEDKAHDPLHKIGHVLEEIPALANKESFNDEDKEAIKKAVDELFDCFGKLDEKMHGKEGATYDEVANRIEQALATLQEHAGAKETK
jgi:outer membrane murein-binding lipoprotein Lpp